MTLEQFFQAHPRAALGFSGGVDSAYLLYAAVQCGVQIQPYFIKTAFQPTFELEDAQKLTAQLGVSLVVLEHDILCHSAVTENPQNRCYHCKTALFGLLKQQAVKDGFSVLLDGTNASDEVADRPGMRALKELSVLSPLRECGLTKAEIRRRSEKAGLFTWNKPAYACLATRVPTGQPLTVELLHRIEAAENALFALGFSDFRVRVFHDAARIQLPAAQWAQGTEQRTAIVNAIKPYFSTVLLDMEVR